MVVALLRRVQKGLHIQTSEIREVLLVGALALLPSVGGAIGSPGIEALFFARFGVEYLPYMYIALGILTMLSSLSLTAALNRIPKSRLYRLLPISLAGLLLLARSLISMGLPGLYPILWLGMYLFWTLQALFIWGIAGMLFDTRQAKRLFPLFAASGILGNALGGLATGPLVAWLGAENLLVIWALTLALAFLLALKITRAYDPPEVHYYRPRPTLKETLVGGGEAVLKSPLLRWLSLAIGLLAVLLFALAFPFSKVVAAQFPDENAVAGFLGVFQGITTALALIVSLGITNRLFDRIGLMGALLVFGLIYMLGFSVLAFMMSFTVLVIFRFAQQAWMMSVADTAYQASFNIVPAAKREPARMFVDGIPKQIGVLLSGVLLLTVQPVLNDHQQFAGSAAIAALALFALWRARAAFTESLAGALAEGQLKIFQHTGIPLGELARDRGVLDSLITNLHMDDVSLRRTTVEILSKVHSQKAKQALLTSLQDPDEHIRKVSLGAIGERDDRLLDGGLMLGALTDASEDVRIAALGILPGRFLQDKVIVKRLEELLNDPSIEVQALAAGQLLKAGNNKLAQEHLAAMAASDDPGDRQLAMSGFRMWGNLEAYKVASQSLTDPDAVVRSRALEAIAQIDPLRCLKPIQNALGDSDNRVRSTAAQVLSSIGPRAVPGVLSALQDSEFEAGALLALEMLPLAPKEQELLDFIRSKRDKALERLRQRSALLNAGADPGPQFLLRAALQERARALTETALRAFRLCSDRETVTLALNGLQSKNADQRATALELLETLDREDLIAPALALWESDSIVEEPGRSTIDQARSRQILFELLDDENDWLRACAAFATRPDDDQQIQNRLQALARSDPDPLVRMTASNRINLEDHVSATTTLPIMERILFLREVPLFTHLSPDELKMVASIAGEHVFKDQETFIREGDLGDEMYIIVSGEVSVLKGGKRGAELARRGPGEFVGEMSVLTNEPRMASVMADGDVFALCIEQGKFERILLEKPEIGLSVMRALIQRLKDSREHPVDARSGADAAPNGTFTV